MKELSLTNCEKTFIQKSVSEGTRLDGRILNESRSLGICFGSEWGSCHVSLGSTQIVSHVSCKVSQPKQTRPNEGLLFINVELGTMGAPNFDANKQSDLNVCLNRLIEKCIRESRCVDLESLCIVSEEKVWCLRVDIHVLNHDGNLIECASIAALTSLAHFKRPDVTTNGEEIIVHTHAEKDPIPTVMHHYPVCVSFGVFADGTIVSDPNLLEETVCSTTGALLVVGMNPYREICLMDMAGAAVTWGLNIIYKATQKAVNRVQFIVKEIKDALAEDERARSNGELFGFANAISRNRLMTLSTEKLSLRLNKFDLNMESQNIIKDSKKRKPGDTDKNTDDDMSADEEDMAVVIQKNITALVPKKEVKSSNSRMWTTMASDEEASDNESDPDKEVEIVKVITANDRIVANINVSSDSEEDSVVMLKTEIAKTNTAPQIKKSKKNKK